MNKYYLIFRVTNLSEKYDHIVACCSDRKTAEQVASKCEKDDPQCFYLGGKTEAEVDANQDKDFLYIHEYEANTIDSAHSHNKCYVITLISSDLVDYRTVAVCSSRARAEQLREELIICHDKSESEVYRDLRISEYKLFSNGKMESGKANKDTGNTPNDTENDSDDILSEINCAEYDLRIDHYKEVEDFECEGW